MRIILVRHGETIENRKGIRMGHMHGKLTAKGKRQARLLAKELKKYNIDAIYSSDLGRAADTAKIIARFHRGTPLILPKQLRERDCGVFEGRPREDERVAREKSGLPHHKWRPPGGESREDVQKRVKIFLTVAKKHKNQTILLVGHGRVNTVILCTLTKTPLKNVEKFELAPNASITIVDVGRKGKAKIKLRDYTKHLSGYKIRTSSNDA